MWSLKFTIENKDTCDALLTKKYKVTSYFYPVDFYRTSKKCVHILSVQILEGEKSEIDKFIKALKNCPKVEKLEQYKNIIVVLMKEEEKFYDLFFNPMLYHPAPAILREGFETWHISAWERNPLEKLIKSIESAKEAFPSFELHSFAKTNLSEIYFPKIFPEIPEMQKKAFQLALKKGYYTWPRKVNLKNLANEMNLSVATFHEHLRKAEAKLLANFLVNPLSDST